MHNVFMTKLENMYPYLSLAHYIRYHFTSPFEYSTCMYQM